MRLSPLQASVLLTVFAASLIATGCGGGSSPTVIVSPPPTYSLSAGALSSSTIPAGTSATSMIAPESNNGYSGTIALSCTVTGASTPLPTCSLSPASISVSSTLGSSSTLTVSASTSDPSGAYSVSITGKDGNNNPPANVPQPAAFTVPFQHVVVIFQENRTPDNLFQDQTLIKRGADIAQQGTNSTQQTILLQPTPLGIPYDLSHKHNAFTEMCDLDTTTGVCKMDGADLISITCTAGVTGCPPPNPQFYYVQASDVQPYYAMAEQYTFADHMFQTNQGPSMPAHQFLISGTSEPSTGSNLFEAENPYGVKDAGDNTGCTSPAAELVALIDPTGTESSMVYPCFEHVTLTDEMDQAGITWRYYAPEAGSIWTAPNAIQHMWAPPNSAACTAAPWANVSLATTANPAPVLTDIAAGQLQQMSWVIPSGVNSDHAGSTSNTGGPSWVAAILNAIGASSYWQNTAILITWDDWGGWYDHVPPMKLVTDGTSWGSGYVYGFRVPMIVVSPLAKPAYISSVNHDFGSILVFLEKNFNLQALGFADTYAPDDLSDCFNLSQAPIVFQTIPSAKKADFFLHDRRPQSGPDDD